MLNSKQAAKRYHRHSQQQLKKTSSHQCLALSGVCLLAFLRQCRLCLRQRFLSLLYLLPRLLQLNVNIHVGEVPATAVCRLEKIHKPRIEHLPL